MNTHKKLIAAFSALVAVGMVAQAGPIDFSGYENITIQDLVTTEGTNFGLDTAAPTYNEDGETEEGTLPGQVWDLERMLYDAASKSLAIVGGYDFLNGEDVFNPGDIFIDTNNSVSHDGNNATGDTYNNVSNADYGYEYVIHFKRSSIDTSSNASNQGELVHTTTSVDYDIIALKTDANLIDVFYNSQTESNPWVFQDTIFDAPGGFSSKTELGTDTLADAGGVLVFSGTATLTKYSTSHLNTDAAAATGWDALTVSSSHGNAYSADGGSGDLHNVFQLNLPSNFADLDTVKLTMGCGNDMIMGKFDGGGGSEAPEGGLTLAMLGFAFGGLGLAARKLRK